MEAISQMFALGLVPYNLLIFGVFLTGPHMLYTEASLMKATSYINYEYSRKM